MNVTGKKAEIEPTIKHNKKQNDLKALLKLKKVCSFVLTKHSVHKTGFKPPNWYKFIVLETA